MSYAAFLVYSLLSVAAGASVALQQVLNSNLREQLASPWWAGFVSYCVGGASMLLVALLAPGPRPSLSAMHLGSGSWFTWTSGVFGAIFIATVILMVPRLGAATVLALIVVGQMLAALLFDHFGMFGLAVHSMSPVRLAGVACLLFGVVLIRT